LNQISVSYPETLAFSLKMRNCEFEQEIKTTAELEADIANA